MSDSSISFICMAVSYTVLTVKAQVVFAVVVALAAWFGWRRAGRAAAGSRIAAVAILFGLVLAHVFVGAVKRHSRTVDTRARWMMEQISIGMPIGEADALLGRYATKIIVDSTKVHYRFRRHGTCELLYGPPSYSVDMDKAGLITKVQTLERD